MRFPCWEFLIFGDPSPCFITQKKSEASYSGSTFTPPKMNNNSLVIEISDEEMDTDPIDISEKKPVIDLTNETSPFASNTETMMSETVIDFTHEISSPSLNVTEVKSEKIKLENVKSEMDTDQFIEIPSSPTQSTTEIQRELEDEERLLLLRTAEWSEAPNYAAITDRSRPELFVNDNEMDLDSSEAQEEYVKKKERSTRKRNKSKGEKDSQKRKRHEKSARTNSSKKRKTSKAGRDGAGILRDLVHQDVFSTSRPAIEPEQAAEFSASTRKKQFENLLKNLPKTANSRSARMDIAAINKAAATFGQHVVKVDGDKYIMKEMNTPLYLHQLMGVSWMYKREKCTDRSLPRGGICADAMGLGKTIEAIATIQANTAKSRSSNAPKTTLIIVPASVKEQWFSEIERHGNFPRVLTYKSTDKCKAIHYTDQDIVLTTWWELSRSCPFPSKELKNLIMGRSADSNAVDSPETESSPILQWIEDNREQGGHLHKIEWYRIILDESHGIKNHWSRQSLAASALKGKYRWALSGTPIMNCLEEIYPYMRFLKHPAGVLSRQKFVAEYCDWANKESMGRLDDLLSKLMLRRTMNDQLLGRPLVSLPTPAEHVLKIRFAPAEKVLYRAFEARLIELMMAESDTKSERDKLRYAIVQLTRLRQFTASWIVVERQLKLVLQIKDLKIVKKKILELGQSADKELCATIDEWITEKTAVIERAKKNGKKAPSEDPEDEHICGICNDVAEDPHFINVRGCKHKFCKTCISEDAARRLEMADDVGDNDDVVCPECNTPYTFHKNLKRWSSAFSIEPFTPRKGKDALKFHPNMEASNWVTKYDRGRIPLSMSAKLAELREQVQVWSREAPTEKVIIFTQWRPLAALIGRILQEDKIKFIYYTGDKSALKRDEAVRKIENTPDIKVMICGLKCGGVGLNLAFASRVINVDLWWNTCIEQQAFCRVYRIPQPLETHFTRLIVEDSVDWRIYELQLKKKAIIDPTMKGKLTTLELAGLFGRAYFDDNDKLIIEPDHRDTDNYTEEDGMEGAELISTDRESVEDFDSEYVDR